MTFTLSKPTNLSIVLKTHKSNSSMIFTGNCCRMHPPPDQSKLVRVCEVQECAGPGNFTMLATIVEIDEIKRYSLELFRYAYVLCMHACCVCTVCVCWMHVNVVFR